jgi:hypothetical protein
MTEEAQSYLGVWITADGLIRVELKSDCHFDELRGDNQHAYHGTYRIDGTTIHFHDPSTGYKATGDLRDGVMHVAGCEFRRK